MLLELPTLELLSQCIGLLRSVENFFSKLLDQLLHCLLQGFINNRCNYKRRDSCVSSLNTDYTYDEAAQSISGTDFDGFSKRGSDVSNNLDLHMDGATQSLCGTEYEGNSSQRSSLTSNNSEHSSQVFNIFFCNQKLRTYQQYQRGGGGFKA